MTPEAYVQQKAAASGSSFYYAFLFLPKPRRAAITAFYAYCREVDDVVDEVSDPGVARTKLAWWQSEVHKAFAGQPSHPACRPDAALPVYGIEPRHLQAVIEGCQMDLEQTRYLDLPGLQRYCHLVAGVVGEVSARSSARPTRHHRLRAQAGPGLPAHQHHPRRGRRRAARAHLPAGERAAAVRREGARNPQAQLFRTLHRPDARSRPSAPTACTTRRWPCCPPPTAAPRSPA
jgi:hypothetical protein